MTKHTETAAALFKEGEGVHHTGRALQERAMARASPTAAARHCHDEMAEYHEAMSETETTRPIGRR